MWWKKILGKKQCACETTGKTLKDADVGQSVAIECLHGEEGVCQRLREMGFCESSVVQKLADSGALICKVCDAKVVISKKLAENIIVKDLPARLPARQGRQDVCLSKDHHARK